MILQGLGFSGRKSAFCHIAFLAVMAFSAIAAAAQQSEVTPMPTPPPEEDQSRGSIKTDLVTLTLTVTDLYGRYVSGLTKDAFTISDNGKEQEITFSVTGRTGFGRNSLDISGSMSGEKIAKAQKALSRFINTSHPSDEYFLIAFNSRAHC